MLDLDHPHTEHIFAAARLEDGLLKRAQRMTLLPTFERESLLLECFDVLDAMRRLNHDHFDASPFLDGSINEAERALKAITYLGGANVVAGRSDGEGTCAVCGTKLTKFKPWADASEWIICCDHCIAPFSTAREKLESLRGFATCAI